MSQNTHIRKATIEDAEQILDFIIGLARYENLEHEVVGSVEDIQRTLFGRQPAAEILLAEHIQEPAVGLRAAELARRRDELQRHGTAIW